jgi:predicted DCC family thiol-disulfide oxidoreductase YuxK
VTRPVLLYDADCKLCRFTARVVVALDRHRSLALLGFEDASAIPLLEGVPEAERSASLRLVLQDGHMLSAGAAALGVLELLPSTRPLARTAEPVHAQPAVGALYAFVARNRNRLGRVVPDGSAPWRYP